MKYRKLGRTGLEVSEIGYGAWGIGGNMWLGSTDDESLAALRRALELGVNFIDTALIYGDGHSEKLAGKVMRESGHRVFVATKVPPKNMLWPARPGIPISRVFPYAHIMASTEQSLRNLGVDSLDLQQLHVWNPEWISSDDWRRAFDDLKRSGKIRAAGISINDHQPDSALDAIRTGLVDSVQVIYNIFDQSADNKLLPLCLERNIGVVARVPLDEGGLTGKITEKTKFEPGDFRNRYFKGDRKKQVVERVGALKQDVGPADGNLPEMALRFCISNPAVSTVIPGMRSRGNVEANCEVSEKGPLPPETLGILRRYAWARNFYE